VKETIETIVKALVDDKESVEITEQQKETSSLYHVKVAQEDIGKVIGKNGRTVKAIRSLLHAAGLKKRKKFILDIAE
jgi:uncharacterized protein